MELYWKSLNSIAAIRAPMRSLRYVRGAIWSGRVKKCRIFKLFQVLRSSQAGRHFEAAAVYLEQHFVAKNLWRKPRVSRSHVSHRAERGLFKYGEAFSMTIRARKRSCKVCEICSQSILNQETIQGRIPYQHSWGVADFVIYGPHSLRFALGRPLYMHVMLAVYKTFLLFNTERIISGGSFRVIYMYRLMERGIGCTLVLRCTESEYVSL